MSLALQGKFKALIPHQSQRLFSPGIFDGSEIEEFPSTFSGPQCLQRSDTADHPQGGSCNTEKNLGLTSSWSL